jgi:hypothetical protein
LWAGIPTLLAREPALWSWVTVLAWVPAGLSWEPPLLAWKATWLPWDAAGLAGVSALVRVSGLAWDAPGLAGVSALAGVSGLAWVSTRRRRLARRRWWLYVGVEVSVTRDPARRLLIVTCSSLGRITHLRTTFCASGRFWAEAWGRPRFRHRPE